MVHIGKASQEPEGPELNTDAATVIKEWVNVAMAATSLNVRMHCMLFSTLHGTFICRGNFVMFCVGEGKAYFFSLADERALEKVGSALSAGRCRRDDGRSR